MLDIALNYSDQLQKLMRNTWYDDRYKYYNTNCYREDLSLASDNWQYNQFVSVIPNQDTAETEVVGFIEYSINRQTNNCCDFGIINFSQNSIVFGADILKVIDDIFSKFHFNKVSFEVVVGNPIESQYDKLMDKFNGRIVGVMKNEVKLHDNNYYDLKKYELMAEDYFKSAPRKRKGDKHE
jgi:hypothetical protein